MTVITQETMHMARYLGLNPNHPHDWPLKTIFYLLDLEKIHGRPALLRELARIMSS